jgi:peptidoglycan hydrolase-like protein with peptidoglycan-binding domain
LPGARTRDAIRKFETDRGLPVAGEISPELLVALRQAHIATQ